MRLNYGRKSLNLNLYIVSTAFVCLTSFSLVTDDKYILQLFRVYTPDEDKFFNNEYIYPVLMWHGLFYDAGSFIINQDGSESQAIIIA